MGKHDHARCEHSVAWCRHCDVVYCENHGCDMTWGKPCNQLHWNFGGTTYPWRWPYYNTTVSALGNATSYNPLQGQMQSQMAGSIKADEPQVTHYVGDKCDHAGIG